MRYHLTLTRAEGGDALAEIPAGVREVAAGTFRGNGAVRSVAVPEGCTSLGDEAFRGCTSLAEVRLPSTLERIGRGCFSGCTSLASVRLPGKLHSLPQDAFGGCSSLAAVEGGSIVHVGRGAFSGCANLVTFVSGALTRVEGRAFNGCERLSGVTFGQPLALVGEMAFRRCLSLGRVELPQRALSLQDGAFGDCGDAEICADEGLVRRFPNAFPRRMADALGILRPADHLEWEREFRSRHAADREALARAAEAAEARIDVLLDESRGLGVLDLRRIDAIRADIESLEAELEDARALMAEIDHPSWDTLVEEFSSG